LGAIIAGVIGDTVIDRIDLVEDYKLIPIDGEDIYVHQFRRDYASYMKAACIKNGEHKPLTAVLEEAVIEETPSEDPGVKIIRSKFRKAYYWLFALETHRKKWIFKIPLGSQNMTVI